MIIGIPKGHLEKMALEALGIQLDFVHPRQICFNVHGNTVMLVKTKDMARMIAAKEIDLGISCAGYLEEWARLTPGNSLESRSITVPHPWNISLITSAGHDDEEIPTKVYTEFPGICQNDFPSATIVEVGGSVEAYVACHNSWGATIVSSGTTLVANGLRVVRVLREIIPCVVYRQWDTQAEQFWFKR